MSFFLADRPLAPGLTFTFAGEEVQHLLGARRMRPGERFAVQGPDGGRFSAEIVAVARRSAEVRVLSPLAPPPPPAVRVTLVQAAVKKEAAESIVQQATELGVAAVCFFVAEHSTVPRRALDSAKAAARLERIAWEACKQSDRAGPPALRTAADLDGALAACPAPTEPGSGPVRDLLLHPGAGRPLAEALRDPASGGRVQAVRLLIGPEGGLSEGERAAAEARGFAPVRLGPTVLRADTAAVAACAVALHGGG